MELSPDATRALIILAGIAALSILVFLIVTILFWPHDDNGPDAILAAAIGILSGVVTCSFGFHGIEAVIGGIAILVMMSSGKRGAASTK